MRCTAATARFGRGLQERKDSSSVLGLIHDPVNRISQKFILSCLVKHNRFHGLEELCHYLETQRTQTIIVHHGNAAAKDLLRQNKTFNSLRKIIH